MPMQLRAKPAHPSSSHTAQVSNRRKKVNAYGYEWALKKKIQSKYTSWSYVPEHKKKKSKSKSQIKKKKIHAFKVRQNHTPEERLHWRRKESMNKSWEDQPINMDSYEVDTNSSHQRNISFSNNSFMQQEMMSTMKKIPQAEETEEWILTTKANNNANPFNLSRSSSDWDSKPDAPFFASQAAELEKRHKKHKLNVRRYH